MSACGSTGSLYILNVKLLQDLEGVVEENEPVPFDVVKEGKVVIVVPLLLLMSRSANYMYVDHTFFLRSHAKLDCCSTRSS
jgi:hypothetical protein